ncbi:unnamed protein product (plasmid) [Mycetohabitans rhizoxinica HKI 454]|uniref:Uncharacterized protein n=1 Tax=Mycetohabitans rhizoxinica (strain DSM 19002 / CIP 109453 / HKI 454) TaxID=882378 RepID=E5AUC9_MYCRK|nr:unnamed protein product [Mycetohabitans rhizoxinica HKI 454]
MLAYQAHGALSHFRGNLFGFLFMAQFSQELAPPQNPGRFRIPTLLVH